MTRDKKIEVRLTIEEYNYIKNICDTMNISISQFIRQTIMGNPVGADKRVLCQHIYKIQNVFNYIYQKGLTREMLETGMMEASKLWQYLN